LQVGQNKEDVMSIDGIIIGAIAFLVIAVFHPLVTYGEYYFGTKLWPVFLCAGIILCAVSLFIENTVFSSALGIIAFSCFWSIFELFNQKKRVERGWFPKKQTGTASQKRNNGAVNDECP
jgi:hypothetical protein